MTTDTEILEDIQRSLHRIEGLLEDAISAYMVGSHTIHYTYNTKRQGRRQKHGGGKHTPEEWQALKAFYRYTCLSCHRQEPTIKLTKDHIDPQGGNTIDNIQPLCHDCQIAKGNQVIDYREGWKP